MPGTENLKIEYVSVDALTPYENNARSHGKDDVKAIADSIREFGFVDPIGVWHDIIVEGHGRLLAAKQIGMTEVPVIRLDQMTDEQRRAYALAHNKTAELSGWDFNVLASELQDIAEIDMSKFGFDMSALGDDEGQQAEEEDPGEFDNIEKIEIHYGVPYQGNKSRIADIIISILPRGERLVDLFGGVEQ